MYELLKTVHIIGVIILMGNVTVSAVWKVFADRTRDVAIAKFAQRLITLTDWTLTLAGIILIVVGGYGMAWANGLSLTHPAWLAYGQILFAVSGTMWLLILVPLQIRLAREARTLSEAGGFTASYQRDNRRWLVWGVIATLPLIAAVYVMTAKPENLPWIAP